MVIALGLIISLNQCKVDPKVDALYSGTPYTLPKLSKKYRPYVEDATNPMTQEGVQLGRMLFYDKNLSADGSISCATCHKQQYAFGDSSELSVNIVGPTKRNTPPLMNLSMNKRFFWDGRVSSLADASADALKGEQHFDFNKSLDKFRANANYVNLFRKAFGKPDDITEEKVHKAIAQFIRTMVSVNSQFDKTYTAGLTAQEYNGLLIFNDNYKGDCFHCHADGPYLTFVNQDVTFANNALDSINDVNDFMDKGLGDFTKLNKDFGKFKIPTIRNWIYTAPYMHDGRFKTIEDVVDHYSDHLQLSPTVDPLMQLLNQGGSHMSTSDKSDLIAFLKTLNDASFVNDTSFANPFK